MNGFDRALDLWINRWPEALSPFFLFFSVAMNYWETKLAFFLVVLGMCLRGARARAAALLSIVAVACANGATDLFKHHLPMHRPFQPEALGGQIILRVGATASMGTASGHAANMCAVATVMTLMLGRWGWPWIGVAFVTGLSRIYVGAHFPSQVLLGWACGAAAGWLVVTAFRAAARYVWPRRAKA